VADRLAGHAVLDQRVEKRAGQDVVEELVEVRCHRGLRRLLPRRTPEDGEHLDGGEQRAAVIGEMWCAGEQRLRLDTGDLIRGEDGHESSWCHLEVLPNSPPLPPW
jgi:hypothetical protein